ncbi:MULTISPECIES: tetratricopeptide repeat protein [unclassified Mesorhizobium]|uniref:tetratricopeptide repeat protein n=1 Tax=unclassified Mesorhizobium TaxID=325217 RepID=UPI000FCBB71E|nr:MULTISPECIES: tetratricopeptide repeat protein [unclassified Mesorhizobium]RVD51825.1 tetratricopeptide repeat protein [Mesorhizobium sp. M8A.F.Ca.ET.023.02.2.1]TGU94074.1 tetratricopeptide repeat protein [Mesorhizobium sp. M00.F.Ca.ET.151.01.1.1]TGV13814.1 tetratricopeptide repeat protein [Mesorhizobium sp. M8A.F.Ca.ET.173.01.1.1]RUW53523.1 tetratricopeptide repeat protein [Mesorhizobium sp. M8A.F.Ca.ET.021.01.1.1]RWC67518.1 MAG: tetratricopeptide repeat protein [Mesorhizobium sp.]
MQQGRARWLTRLAIVTGMAISALPAYAKQSTEPVKISSFSGAYLAARIAEGDNDLDSAIAYYKQALAFNPSDTALQQSLMLSLIAQGRFDESLVYADKLKEVPDVERFSRLALAVDSFHKKDFTKAQYWLKLSLESDLDRLISGVMSGWAEQGAGQASEAMASIDKLQGPDWFGLFKSFHRALIADAANMPEKAEAIYAATMQDTAAGGAAPETWMRNAQAYASFLARKGDKAKAISVLDQAEAFSPGKLEIVALRARISKGDKIAPFVSGPSDGASEILLDLATALNRGGGEPFVRLYLQYALALKPDSDAALVQLAAVAEQLKDGEGAIALYRRIPDSSPLKEISDLQLGLNLADLDRHDEAITHLKAFVEAHPDDMRAYLALGGVYSSKDDFRSAANLYDKAVEVLKTPTAANWNIFYQRGIAYERLKEWPKAEPNFRKALELQPDQPQVLNYLGYSWVDMNTNLKEGLEMIQKAVDLRPSDGYIVDSLGWAYFRLGRFDDAVREMERAVSLKPEDPVLNDHLGDAYWRVGRKLEATFQWNQARDLKPDPDVLATLQQKLMKGLPPIESNTAQETPKVKPEPVPAPKG